jgi:hypothetical protein
VDKGGGKMKKLLFAAMLLGMVIGVHGPALAQVSVSIGFPPPIEFAAPPEVIVLPGTYVYVVPDAPEDIFFYDGWWWRRWEDRWYRSRDYGSGWGYYRSVPNFYRRIPSDWRTEYREHRWGGQPWNYHPIPHQELQHNWQGWQKNKHWEKQQTWGVEGYKSGARSREAFKQKQHPEMQGEQQQKQMKQQRQPKQKHPEMQGEQQQKQMKQQHQPKQKHPEMQGEQQQKQMKQQHQPKQMKQQPQQQQQHPGAQHEQQPKQMKQQHQPQQQHPQHQQQGEPKEKQ